MVLESDLVGQFEQDSGTCDASWAGCCIRLLEMFFKLLSLLVPSLIFIIVTVLVVQLVQMARAKPTSFMV